MAKMSAVTKRCGACHQVFIILPLVGAFFINIANVIIIKALLGWVAWTARCPQYDKVSW
jgi:ESS family glutamate:Na+ symporter